MAVRGSKAVRQHGLAGFWCCSMPALCCAALHRALDTSLRPVCGQALMEAGAAASVAPLSDGNTALHLAAERGHMGACDVMLRGCGTASLACLLIAGRRRVQLGHWLACTHGAWQLHCPAWHATFWLLAKSAATSHPPCHSWPSLPPPFSCRRPPRAGKATCWPRTSGGAARCSWPPTRGI